MSSFSTAPKTSLPRISLESSSGEEERDCMRRRGIFSPKDRKKIYFEAQECKINIFDYNIAAVNIIHFKWEFITANIIQLPCQPDRDSKFTNLF